MRSCIAACRSPSVIEDRRDGYIFIWRVKNAGGSSQATKRTTPPLVRSKYEDPCSNLFCFPPHCSVPHCSVPHCYLWRALAATDNHTHSAPCRGIYVVFSLMPHSSNTCVILVAALLHRARLTILAARPASHSPIRPASIVSRARRSKRWCGTSALGHSLRRG
jgi:hypothetical protein